MSLFVGQPAPFFTAPMYDPAAPYDFSRTVSLADYAGRWVIFFGICWISPTSAPPRLPPFPIVTISFLIIFWEPARTACRATKGGQTCRASPTA